MRLIPSLFLLLLFTMMTSIQVWALETAVGSLTRVVGKVNLDRAIGNKSERAYEGVLVYTGDHVVTSDRGRATLIFRDGSEVRIFESTKFLVEEARELQTTRRSFAYKLRMSVGSFWARMMPGRQKTSVSTPTTTIGVKGTAFRVTESDQRTSSVAVSEGEVEVKNTVSTTNLTAGKRLNEVTSEDHLPEKVEDIPMRLSLKSETLELKFQQSSEEVVRLSLQLIDMRTGSNVNRTGAVYLRSDYKNIVFPSDVTLDNRGFVRVPVKIGQPGQELDDFDGTITVWAMMDELHSQDVGANSIQFRIPQGTSTHRYILDANTGKYERQE